jgi:hypothetical protein
MPRYHTSVHFSRRISMFFTGFCALVAASSTLAQTMPATAPALLPIPDAITQDKSRLLIYDLFKSDYAKTSAADRQALGKLLLSQAAATKDDPTARYVLLLEATDLAALSGDPDTAFQSAATLARYYQVDGLELKTQALFRTNYIVTAPGPSETICRMALDTADEAALADAFDTVEKLVNLAEGAAEKTHKVAVVTSIQTRIADLRSLIRDFPKIQKARDLLADDPTNADAHLLIGTFYALRKGQWSIALPHLAASNDAALRSLSQRDLASPTDQLQQALLGDAWWDYGETASGALRTNTQRHACDWYRLAQSGLAGLTLTRIQTRMQKYPAVPSARSETLAAGNAIDLLPLFDLAKDAPNGKWSLTNNTLQCTPAKYACIQIPYTPPDEYDLRTTFVRTEGDSPITVLLASHNKSFGFALDVKGIARFERVAGTIAKNNPTTAPVVISNNHRYTLTVQIRNDLIRALLDDKLITQWKTDFKDLTRYELWKLPAEKLCGLGVNNARVIFYSVELIDINGKGRPLR